VRRGSGEAVGCAAVAERVVGFCVACLFCWSCTRAMQSGGEVVSTLECASYPLRLV
jgi:hypothetical protein